MKHMLVLAVLGFLLVPHSLCGISSFKPTGECEGKHNIYKYTVEQSQFEDENKETLKIECTVIVTCISVGLYEKHKSKLYSMVVQDSKLSGNMIEKELNDTTDDTTFDIDDEKYDGVEKEPIRTVDDMMKGWFKFVQTDDGAIPAVFHHESENSQAVNFKKTIASAFQANFKGTSSKVEADSQSVHKSKYTYKKDKKNKVVKMHRSVTSNEVEEYATHVPGDTVGLDKEEDMEYTRGVLTHSKGVTTAKIMPTENKENEVEGGSEGDSLEAETGSRKRRDIKMSDYFDFSESEEEKESMIDEQMNEDGFIIQEENNKDNPVNQDENNDNQQENDDDDKTQATYDPNTKLPEIDAKATYSLDLVGQKRVLTRERRDAASHLELPEAMESSLIAHIDHAHEDMEHMARLRSKLKDIHQVLQTIHSNPNTSSKLERKIEQLISLESTYGSLPEFTPVIDSVINYLQQLFGSVHENDQIMRGTLCFMISKAGSYRAQKVLLEALDKALNEEEERMIMIDVAFIKHPQPQMITELENRIRNDSTSTHPLLLAYGALVAMASPKLQQRMTLFLLNQLEDTSLNTSVLVHQILSLGNTESPHVTSYLMDYLSHPDESVQLNSIHALRYATGEPEVQKALGDLVRQSNMSHNLLHSVLQTLIFGLEHASNSHKNKPFNFKLSHSLISSVMTQGNEELQQVMIKYLQRVNNEQSARLLQLMTAPHSDKDSTTNTTRVKRGTSYWASSHNLYNLVSPLSTRQSDVNYYTTHKSYLWGKYFGVSKGNLQVAAGGFVGVNRQNFKLFGRAKAVGHAFGKSKTGVDIKVQVKKSHTTTNTEIYVAIAGKTLVNMWRSDNVKSHCKQYYKPLYSKKFTLFDFGIPVFIGVGFLRFNLAGYVKLHANLETKVCQKGVSLTGEAKLTPSISMELEAGASASILSLVRGGISVSAVFTYKVDPTLSTTICLSGGIKVKNCATSKHGWDSNKIKLYAWYQRRKIWPFLKWGPRKKWNRLSKTWTIGRSSMRQLFNYCDASFSCGFSAPPKPTEFYNPMRVSVPIKLRTWHYG